MSEGTSKNAAETLTALGALAAAIPYGAPTEYWDGSTALSTFAKDLPGLGDGMKQYAELIGKGFEGVTSEEALAAKTTLEGLVTLTGGLPSSSEWTKTFGNYKDLGTFGDDVESSARALAPLQQASPVSVWKKADVALKVMDLIRNFTSGMENNTGIFNDIASIFAGTKADTLKKQAADMAAVGVNLKTFADSITSLSVEKAEGATDVLDVITDFKTRMTGSEGALTDIAQWFVGGNKDITTISREMAVFGTQFKTYSDGVSGAANALTDTGIITQILTALNGMSTSLEDGTGGYDLTALLRVAIEFGQGFITELIGSIQEGDTKVVTAGGAVVGAALAEISLGTLGFFSAGLSFAQGLANGIAAGEDLATTAAKLLGERSVRALKDGIDSDSPSKKTLAEGGNFTSGFNIGILSGIKRSWSRLGRWAMSPSRP